ncbi:MAG TPA: beta-propeller fold lactonase family protein [Vicinamibacterales bacterium]|nr:beta-propeller fold lactonase family protein [Vicinamibacterales bacterium]
MRTSSFSLLAAAITLAACADATSPSRLVDAASLDGSSSANATVVGGVFTQTNDAGPGGNAVVAYARHADGSLSYLGSYATGGVGSAPTGLGSQGGLVLSPNERFLFVVNAGSNQISSFSVAKNGLTLLTTVASGGTRPVSVAATNHILYAINNTSHSLAGFRIEPDGRLTHVPEWTRPLNARTGNAAQVQFTRDGRFLVVVERGIAARGLTPGFDVFPVNLDGSLGAAVASTSMAAAPFGFDITKRGHLVVSEPGGADNSASSYDIESTGALRLVSSRIPANQGAPCWVVITKDGQFAYTANVGSGSISGYAVAEDGKLALLNSDGRTGVTGDGTTPLDMDVSRDSRFLYVIEGGTGNVMGFAIGKDGSLAPIADAPPPASGRGRGGLAAY